MKIYSSLLAYLTLTAALSFSGGQWDLTSMLLVLATLGLALTGCCLEQPGGVQEPGADPARWLPGVLGILVAAEWVALLVREPSIFRDYPGYDFPLWWFRLGVLVLGLLAASYARPDLPLPGWRFPAILVVYLFLGGWVLRNATYEPLIDVWHLQQDASAFLIQGDNPYAAEYQNPYDEEQTSLFLGKEQIKNGKIQSFPYPPLSLVLAVPGYLLGDVRWSLLLAMLGTAAFIVATGRRLGLPPGHPAELAAVSLLCHPRGLLVLEAAWTEPFLALAAAASIWAVAGGRRSVFLGALASVVAVKQIGILFVPPMWLAARARGYGRLVLGSVVLAALTFLPFILWDREALWRGVIGFHLYSPFREDSLSVLAGVDVLTGYRPPAALGFLAAVVVIGLVVRRSEPGLAQAALGGAAIYLAFFAFNKAAHLNYYWLVETLLVLALVAAVGEGNGTTYKET